MKNRKNKNYINLIVRNNLHRQKPSQGDSNNNNNNNNN